jgi:hypothetical protein
VAVFDFGGGTLDVAVLRRVDDPDDPWTVLASDGIDPLGGDLVDQRLLSAVFERLQLRGEDEIVSLLRNPAHRGAVLTLREQIRAAKQDLSENAQAEIPIVVADRTVVVSLTADELDEIVRDDVAAGISLMRATLQRAGVDPAELHALYLTGGSSLLRAVHEGIRGLLGNRPATLEDPKLVVAMGAHLAVSAAEETVSPHSGNPGQAGGAAEATHPPSQTQAGSAAESATPTTQAPQWNPIPARQPVSSGQPGRPSWLPQSTDASAAVSPAGLSPSTGATPAPRAPVFGPSQSPATSDGAAPGPTDEATFGSPATRFGVSTSDTAPAPVTPDAPQAGDAGGDPEPASAPKAPTWATTAAASSTRPTAGEAGDSSAAPVGASTTPAATTPRSGELSAAASRMLELHPELAAALDEHPEGRAVIDDEACLVALMTVPGLLQQVSRSVTMMPSRQVPCVYNVGAQGTYDIPLPIKVFFPNGAPWLPRDPGLWLADPVKRQPALWALSVIRTWCTANDLEQRRILSEPAWDQWLSAPLPQSILPLQNGFQVAVGYTPAQPPTAPAPDYGLCVRPPSVTPMQRQLASAFEPYYRLVEAGRLTGRRGAGVVIECLGSRPVRHAVPPAGDDAAVRAAVSDQHESGLSAARITAAAGRAPGSAADHADALPVGTRQASCGGALRPGRAPRLAGRAGGAHSRRGGGGDLGYEVQRHPVHQARDHDHQPGGGDLPTTWRRDHPGAPGAGREPGLDRHAGAVDAVGWAMTDWAMTGGRR